jgi:tetratricopeptide (TPR) repeat protein
MASRAVRGRGARRFEGWAAVLWIAASLAASACAGGDDLEKRLDVIRTRHDEGKAAETLDELTELVERHAENPELNYRLGVAMLAAGRPTEAVFPLHKAAATDEFAVTAGIVLSSTLAQTNNHADALRAADRVLERDPEHEAALLLRATSAVQLHDGAAALASADRLIEKAPENKNFRFVRASALAEANRLDEAEDALEALFDADWEGEPQGRIRACMAYARFLFEKVKDGERAVAQLKGCVEKSPDDIQMLASVGNILEEFKETDEMLPLLQGAVERNPDSSALRSGLVAQLVAADQVNEAQELSEKWASEADDSQSWYQVANVRRRTGDVAGALEALEKGISLSTGPVEDDFLFVRAEMLLELGKLDESETQAASIKGELYKHIINGRLAQERGDAKRALELYGKVSTEWPQNYAVRALAARAAYDLGDTERAKSDLLEATRQAPEETDAALWLARIYFSEGNFRQTLEFAGRHIKQRGVLEPSAYLLTAETLALTKRTEQALIVLDDLAKLRDGEFRSVAWVAAAQLRARTEPEQALGELERRIAEAKLDLADPAQSPALRALIELLVQNGRAAEAEKRLAGLIAKHPDSAQLIALHGRVELTAGRLDASAADFARALALAPNEPTALSGLALVQREQGDLAKAIESMRKAAAAAPNDPDHAYMAARMVWDQGDRAAARSELERVLRDHPESAAAANDLAFLLAEDSTDLALAQRHAERAVRLRPSPETLDTLGYVKLRQGAAEEAVGLFERALSREPSYATARYHLALALIDKGEPVAARQALEEALAKPFPEQQEARKVLAKIDGGKVEP